MFFTKFASVLAADTSAQAINRSVLQKASVLCVEVRQLLQRTLEHAQSAGSAAACAITLGKFGSSLRCIACSVTHLLLQIIAQTDERAHGSCACAPIVHELLLLAQFLHSSLALPLVAASYSSCVTFPVPAQIEGLLSPDTIPSMTLPQSFSALLFKRCHDNLRRYSTPPPTQHRHLVDLMSAQGIRPSRREYGYAAYAAHIHKAAAAALNPSHHLVHPFATALRHHVSKIETQSRQLQLRLRCGFSRRPLPAGVCNALLSFDPIT